MDTNQILARLQNIFRDFFDEPDLIITEKTNAEDIPDWDSLANVNIILAAEREFGCYFDTDEIKDFRHVGDIISVIEAKTS